MKSPNKQLAPWAGMLVVVAGSASFVYSAFLGSYEMVTASAAFTGAGLYLLFGKDPPRAPSL